MILEVDKLVKRYNQLTAVNGLSLDVQEGEIFGLLGPNGSGKTTAINCILALLDYEAGDIRLFGEPMAPDAYQLKREIGIVTQNVAVYEELTVYENIDYFCSLYVKDKAERRQLVEEALDFVDLHVYRKFLPKKLSGGLLRRLNIACGVAHKPKLIILDEPTVAVDPQSRNHILEGIQTLNRQGATIIYTSHYMEEVEQICTRIAIIDKGELIAAGTADQLKRLINYSEKVTVQGVDKIDSIEAKLIGFPHMTAFERNGDSFSVKFEGHQQNLARLLDWCRQEGIHYESLYSDRPTLNDVFLEITGKDLRD